jgi:hypothetical protein
MDKLIYQYCNSPSENIFFKLNKDIQELLIKTSFDVLSQKIGNLEKALEILQNTGDIKVLHDYIIYTDKKKILSNVEELSRKGITTIPIINPDKLKKYQEDFNNTLLNFPEYQRNPKDNTQTPSGNNIVYVLGGFAALGNPASFHNPFVRKLRVKCWKKTIKLFYEYIKNYHDKELKKKYKIEVLFDRMMFRKKGQQAVEESWHRDVIPTDLILKTDEIYGGWINLDNTDQYFSCIPGSHLGIRQYDIPSGFDTMIKRESEKAKIKYKEEYNKIKDNKDKEKFISKKIKNVIDEVSKYRHTFIVPPGHMVIFPQYILHEVIATPAKTDMLRLFLGWRITTSDNSLLNNEKIMKDQSVVPLPGGMIPPMYSSNHASNFLGFPIISKISDKDKEKWINVLVERYISICPTDNMKKLYKQKYTSKTIAKMTTEYLSYNKIELEFDENKFIDNESQKISINIFRPIPDSDTPTSLIKWSIDTMHKNTLVKRDYKKNEGSYYTVKRHMDSLKDYGFPLYPQYSEKEKLIYKPNRIDLILKMPNDKK